MKSLFFQGNVYAHLCVMLMLTQAEKGADARGRALAPTINRGRPIHGLCEVRRWEDCSHPADPIPHSLSPGAEI